MHIHTSIYTYIYFTACGPPKHVFLSQLAMFGVVKLTPTRPV